LKLHNKGTKKREKKRDNRMRTSALLLQCYLSPALVAGYSTLPSVPSLQLRASSFTSQALSSSSSSSSHPSIVLFANNDDSKDNTDEKVNDNNNNMESSFNPLDISEDEWSSNNNHKNKIMAKTVATSTLATIPLIAGITALSSTAIDKANAATSAFTNEAFNPDNFRPVCPTSDSIYRIAQGTTQGLVGQDNFVEYGPLIAGGLLRVRLELCVVESFFNEAVGPFIEKEGLGWILPLHETVETFLAGTIFALASTFILVGSTKIVSVLITYLDVFIGSPLRLFGGFAFDRAKGKPVTLDIGFGPFKKRVIGPGDPKDPTDNTNRDETLEEIFDFSKLDKKDLPVAFVSGAAKGVGETSKIAREVAEAVDLFVGRYLTLIATGYIGFKFLHFKIFPDFPPF
jgi:hypothetical protein